MADFHTHTLGVFQSSVFLQSENDGDPISLKYSRNGTYSCTLTALYINFRSDTYKLYPRYLSADVLKMSKTARQEAVYELGFSSLESGLFPSLVLFIFEVFMNDFMNNTALGE